MRNLAWLAIAFLPGRLLDADVVTYPAPAAETLWEDFQVWADGHKVDVYAARVLDPPFADQGWDHGGPYGFANFDVDGPVQVTIRSPRSLRQVVVRPADASIRLQHEDSSHSTIVPRHSQRVTIRDVKSCNSRVQNDDGINPCNSQDVLITDCFIRSDDDCIALKGLDYAAVDSNVERITVENCILRLQGADAQHEVRGVVFDDMTILGSEVTADSPRLKVGEHVQGVRFVDRAE